MNYFVFEAPWPGFEPESRARQAHMIAPTPPGQGIQIVSCNNTLSITINLIIYKGFGKFYIFQKNHI